MSIQHSDNISTSSGSTQVHNQWFAKKTTICELAVMIEAPEYAEIGARLALIRTSLSDLTQRAWAEKQGFNQTQYNNWEKGIRRITVDAAEVLCTKYGLTLDAIYRGRLDGLSETARKIF